MEQSFVTYAYSICLSSTPHFPSFLHFTFSFLSTHPIPFPGLTFYLLIFHDFSIKAASDMLWLGSKGGAFF